MLIAKILLCISDETWAQDFLDMLELLRTMGLLKLVCIEIAMNLWEGVCAVLRCQVGKEWSRIQDHLCPHLGGLSRLSLWGGGL